MNFQHWNSEMPDFKDIPNFHLIAAFLIPGLIIAYVRSRFITGRTPSQAENLLTYLVLCLGYYALTIPFLKPILEISGSWPLRAAVWILLTLAGPAIVGIGLGAWAQKDCGSWFATKVGLGTIHVIPAAWDWRFSTVPRGGMFVMVTLSDDSRVAGFFGSGSFASSDTNERDVYIEEEYDVTDAGDWTPRPSKVGILIPLREIKYIEFWEP